MPFKRLERLEGNVGIPLPAATQWGLVEREAERMRPALEELIRQAAQGEVAHNDDTGMRILKLAREPEGRPERTGTFTSGIVSRVGTRLIALFFSGWKHAGENLAEVLKRRAPGLQPLIQMCDALSRNALKLSEGVRLLLANCLAHGRRQFVEVAVNFPAECRYVLETLGGVWYNDELARRENLSSDQRLRFHQEHSEPLMKTLHEWMEAQAPSLPRRYPASPVLRTHPSFASAANIPRGLAVGSECHSSPRTQTSLVAYRSYPVRAAITTPVEPRTAFLVRFARGAGLPRYYGESASTLTISRPARCSLALRPARTADPPKRTFS